MYEKKDVSPVKATDLLVFGQISFFFVGLIATERRKIWVLGLRHSLQIKSKLVRFMIIGNQKSKILNDNKMLLN